MNQQPKPVLVAVGPDGADAAVAFAAEEAQLVEAPMHLVHVLQMHAAEAYAGAYGAGYAYGGRYGAVLDGADAVLDTALRRARDLTDSRVPVTVERIDDGFVVARLVEHADRARLVVMEHRRLGHLRRLVTGSTVNGVAARAGVPVVSVPEGWAGTDGQMGVTVGVQDVHEAGPLLRTAFQEAAVRQAGLTVLHAWWIDNGFDIVVAEQSELDQREAQTRRELEPMLAALASEFPTVLAHLQVRHAPATEALLDSAGPTELLVLGRRHHLLPFGSHLGPVARSVLAHAECPVLLAPEERVAAPRTDRSHITGVMY